MTAATADAVWPHGGYGSDQPGMAPSRVERLSGIELGRIIACLAVILIHQKSFEYGDTGYFYEALNQSARWAVPFFFVLSGYFMPAGRNWVSLTIKYFTRLFPVSVFWVAFYAWVEGEPLWFLEGTRHTLAMLAYGGSGYHLWFLPSLGVCLLIAAIVLQFFSAKVLFAVSAVLFSIGLLFGPYAPVVLDTPYDEISLPFSTRNGACFGLIFVSLGVLLRRYEVEANINTAFRLLGIGAALTIAEIAFLWSAYDVPPTGVDFVLGTLPLGFGAALLFLSIDIRQKVAAQFVRRLGSVSLGIYAVHLVVLRQLTGALGPDSMASGFLVALAAWAVSSAIALVGGQVPVLQRVFR
ncbi:acyltransferase [Paracoccus sp. (in: a-proteobacteria)]|uniref:acyltransferase n=1 Tax=Paracoccus sp. TaxID=267 RepID=UPI00396CBBA5